MNPIDILQSHPQLVVVVIALLVWLYTRLKAGMTGSAAPGKPQMPPFGDGPLRQPGRGKAAQREPDAGRAPSAERPTRSASEAGRAPSAERPRRSAEEAGRAPSAEQPRRSAEEAGRAPSAERPTRSASETGRPADSRTAERHMRETVTPERARPEQWTDGAGKDAYAQPEEAARDSAESGRVRGADPALRDAASRSPVLDDAATVARDAVRGIVWAELLAPPRAKRPYRRR